MASSFRSRQAGEGKVGCFVTLAILVLAIAAAIKAGPVYYSNNELVNEIKSNIGPEASRAPFSMSAEDLAHQLTEQIRHKAKDLDIPEAQKPGAVTVSVVQSTSDTPGNVHVVLRYARTVDFYGVTSYDFNTDEVIDITIMTNIK